MIQTIPAQTVVTCDVCGRECSDDMLRKSGKLKLEANGLDFQGCACGPAGFELDLCDNCVEVVRLAIGQMKLKINPTLTP